MQAKNGSPRGGVSPRITWNCAKSKTPGTIAVPRLISEPQLVVQSGSRACGSLDRIWIRQHTNPGASDYILSEKFIRIASDAENFSFARFQSLASIP